EQLRQLRRRAVAEIHAAVQLEPVDARGDTQVDAPRRAIGLALGLDVPARLRELAHDVRQAARREHELLLRAQQRVAHVLTPAELLEPVRRFALRGLVAQQDAALGGL